MAALSSKWLGLPPWLGNLHCAGGTHRGTASAIPISTALRLLLGWLSGVSASAFPQSSRALRPFSLRKAKLPLGIAPVSLGIAPKISWALRPYLGTAPYFAYRLGGFMSWLFAYRLGGFVSQPPSRALRPLFIPAGVEARFPFSRPPCPKALPAGHRVAVVSFPGEVELGSLLYALRIFPTRIRHGPLVGSVAVHLPAIWVCMPMR